MKVVYVLAGILAVVGVALFCYALGAWFLRWLFTKGKGRK